MSLAGLLELRGDCAGGNPGGRRERRANEGGCAEHCDGVLVQWVVLGGLETGLRSFNGLRAKIGVVGGGIAMGGSRC